MSLNFVPRIVDDIEILWCVNRVYWHTRPRPSRRRVLRALIRTIRAKSEVRYQRLVLDEIALLSVCPAPRRLWWLASRLVPRLVAHPLERLAFGTKTKTFWSGWGGALLAHFGFAAPRVVALQGFDPTLARIKAQLRRDLHMLPVAVAAVCIARLVAFVLFGADDHERRLRRHLESKKRTS